MDLLAMNWHPTRERIVFHLLTLDFHHQPALVLAVLSRSLPCKSRFRYLSNTPRKRPCCLTGITCHSQYKPEIHRQNVLGEPPPKPLLVKKK